MKIEQQLEGSQGGWTPWNFWMDHFKNKVFSQPEDGVRIWSHKLRDNPLPTWKPIKSQELTDHHEWNRYSLGPILFVFFLNSACSLASFFFSDIKLSSEKNLLCFHLDSCIEFFPAIIKNLEVTWPVKGPGLS